MAVIWIRYYTSGWLVLLLTSLPALQMLKKRTENDDDPLTWSCTAISLDLEKVRNIAMVQVRRQSSLISDLFEDLIVMDMRQKGLSNLL